MGRLAAPLRLLFPALAVALVSGCGDSFGGRQAVSGTVLFKGNPLDQGNIRFIPDSPDLPTQAGTGIANGAYEISQAQGLVPGKYRVSISSADGKTPVVSDVPPGPSGNFSSKERIPLQYNVDSKHEVVVTKGGPNKFDFKIP